MAIFVYSVSTASNLLSRKTPGINASPKTQQFTRLPRPQPSLLICTRHCENMWSHSAAQYGELSGRFSVHFHQVSLAILLPVFEDYIINLHSTTTDQSCKTRRHVCWKAEDWGLNGGDALRTDSQLSLHTLAYRDVKA